VTTKTKEIHTLLLAEEVDRLEQIAGDQNRSLAQLIRNALAIVYFRQSTAPTANMDLPVDLPDDASVDDHSDQRSKHIAEFRSLSGILADCPEFESAIGEMDALWRNWQHPEFA
jgi:hypothetical protein